LNEPVGLTIYFDELPMFKKGGAERWLQWFGQNVPNLKWSLAVF